MFTRRCILSGCIPRKISKNTSVTNNSNETKGFVFAKERFYCAIEIETSSNNDAYALKTYVKWYDPISMIDREDIENKWYITKPSFIT